MPIAELITDPLIDETVEFRRRLAAGTFCLQRCESCGTLHFPPGPSCWRCGSIELTWVPVADGSATVRSMTTCFRSFMSFADQVPYTVVLGELNSYPGVRVIARLETESDVIAIGSRVMLTWHSPCGAPASYHWQLAP
jgi:uncharacterized OB-fold protein